MAFSAGPDAATEYTIPVIPGVRAGIQFEDDPMVNIVRLTKVEAGGLFARAGVKTGILAEVDGRQVTRVQEVADIITEAQAAGRPEFTVKIAPDPHYDAQREAKPHSKPREYLIRADPNPHKLCGFNAVTAEDGTSVRIDIRPEGLFADAGACNGRLLSINGHPVMTTADVEPLIAEARRSGQTHFPVVILPESGVSEYEKKRPLGANEYWIEVAPGRPFGISTHSTPAGVELDEVHDNGLFAAAGVPRGILTEINGYDVLQAHEVARLLEDAVVTADQAYFSVRIVPNPERPVQFKPKTMRPTDWDAFLDYWEDRAEDELRTL